MAIVSHAFGQVRLTDKDADKFYNQVTFGKPKPAASDTVKAGATMFQSYQKSGKYKVTVKANEGR